MKKFLVVLLLMLALVLPVRAQETTPEPDSPIVTVEQQQPETPNITVVQPEDNSPSVVVIDKPVAASLSETEIILVVALFIIVVGGAFVITRLLNENKELASQLHDTLPSWALDWIHQTANQGLNVLHTAIEETPNTIDDDLYQRVHDLEQRLYDLIKNAPPLPPKPVAPPGEPLS